MHLIMILAALAVAWWLRLRWAEPRGTWLQRWQQSLFLFLFSPLLLLMTAIAVLCMGTQGQMLGLQTGWFSYVLTLSCLGIVVVLCLKLAWEGWQSLKSARNCPPLNLEGRQVRLLNTGALFAAQIGFWQPELVVSQGLLQTLAPAHLETVLAHEQGHYYYRDTFWFFWLGWMRSCTAWLPNTDALWQELLVLRELRADHWAALQVDPLLLAESLLMVVSTSPVSSEVFCAALDSASSRDRLEERIDALLAQPKLTPKPSFQSWTWVFLAFLPLVTVLFHT